MLGCRQTGQEVAPNQGEKVNLANCSQFMHGSFFYNLAPEWVTDGRVTSIQFKSKCLIDLLMGRFRGAVFHHDRRARKQAINQQIEMPTSNMVFTGRFQP